jgi:transcriptional regulator with XRE-family HTH domain
MPSQITEGRKRLKLTQAELANYLKVAEESINRWEKGRQIQQRSLDLLLRAFFNLPEFQRFLDFHAAQKKIAVRARAVGSGEEISV